MNNAWLKAFLTVYQTKSVSKTAELLFLTQPTITSRIQALETELGTSLFYRSNRRLTPTEAGKVFYPYAKNILGAWQKGAYEVQKLSNSYTGELTIALFYAGIDMFSSMVTKFSEQFPSIKLNIKTAHSKEIVELVQNHIVDIGFTSHDNHRQLGCEILFEDKYALITHSTNNLAFKASVELEELENERFILSFGGNCDYNLNKIFFDSLPFKPSIIAEVDNLRIVKQMVTNELGCTLLPKRLLAKEINEGLVTIIPVQFKHAHKMIRNHHLIWQKESFANPIHKKFIEFILVQSQLQKT